MMHNRREWTIKDAANVDELVEWLTEYTWCGCSGFRAPNGDLWLNDSTGGDGAQEYGVIRDGVQIESVTVSWCTPERLRELIDGGIGTEFSYGAFRPEQIVPAEGHRCGLCA